jgi:hypothetical protein
MGVLRIRYVRENKYIGTQSIFLDNRANCENFVVDCATQWGVLLGYGKAQDQLIRPFLMA